MLRQILWSERPASSAPMSSFARGRTFGMTLGRARHEPLQSRLLIVLGAIVFFALVGGRAWSRDRDDRWAFVVVLVAYLALVAGLVVAAGFAVSAGLARSRCRERAARFIVTREGFAVSSAIPPGLVVAELMGLLGMQVGTLVDVWPHVTDARSTVPTDITFAGVTSIVVFG